MLFKIYVVGEEEEDDDDILWRHKTMMTHLRRLLLK
jgi:hypothetical protein